MQEDLNQFNELSFNDNNQNNNTDNMRDSIEIRNNDTLSERVVDTDRRIEQINNVEIEFRHEIIDFLIFLLYILVGHISICCFSIYDNRDFRKCKIINLLFFIFMTISHFFILLYINILLLIKIFFENISLIFNYLFWGFFWNFIFCKKIRNF